MTGYLCISVTLLDSLFHGKADHGESEWPPSPLRLFQAMLRGARTGCRESQWTNTKTEAFEWLERIEPPLIVAPRVSRANEYTLFVPNNDSDKEPERQNRLTSKIARPHRLPEDVEHCLLHYLWRVSDRKGSSAFKYARLLCDEARHLLALGWGIDQAVASGRILSEVEAQALEREGISWRPLIGQHPSSYAHRVPTHGTLRNLETVYKSFVNSVNGRQYTPPLKPSVFDRVCYVPPNYVPSRPFAVFELRHDNGSFCLYPKRKLMHIAGMVRHLAKELMSHSPPPDVGEDWIERYVAGHRDVNVEVHRQFSYLPLPSIGHKYADQSVRRVMIAAPMGDEAWLEHLAYRMAGRQLKPENGDEFGEQGPPTLVRVYRDNVARHHTGTANQWASVTPVILPGHDDRKPAKTRKLIEAALAQSGIEQPCTYEWSAFARFRNSLSAHKYDRNKRANFYLPTYLQSRSVIHLTLTFKDELKVTGPLVIGAGRHCGFGLMAAV